MYQRPQLQRFGSLRELTQAGWNGDNDGFFIKIASNGQQGCGVLPSDWTPGCS